MSNSVIVQTKNLKKTYSGKKGASVEAVKGIDLTVRKGEIFGFLGPNGAGKTTCIKMLTTLLAPTSGQAKIVGFDLIKNPQKVRQHIGYVSQAGGTDTEATAIENLILQARLYGIDPETAKKRTQQLIDDFSMNEFATRVANSYSGGQKRRLDLALGIIHQPPLIFLDEPTLGLDPQSRANFWEEIKKVSKMGTTIFLTTHYLDEADILCDTLAIVDHGTIVAEGTPSQLKRKIGDESILVGFSKSPETPKAIALMEKQKFITKIFSQDNILHLYVKDGEKLLPQVLRIFDQNKVVVQTISLSKPSLDDVFLQKTGRSLRESAEG